MSTAEGPFLYDEDPAPLHTGAPRRRPWLLLALLLATVLVAVGMALGLFLVRGTPAERSEEAVAVFLAALEQGDGETTHGLLCEELRATTGPGEVPADHRRPLPARVTGSVEAERDGAPVYEVAVAWADGTTTSFTVINEDGPRLCGTSPAS
jgi:hypothetical protein